MARNLARALRLPRTAEDRRDLVYRARDVLRLLRRRIEITPVLAAGSSLLSSGAVLWALSWFEPHEDTGVIGPVYIGAGIIALFIHGEIKRRRMPRNGGSQHPER